MPIIKNRTQSNFTQISNGILRDQKLPMKERGVLCTLLSFPDKWKFSVEGLSAIVPDGRDSLNHQMLCEKVNASGQTQQAVIIDAIKQVPIVSKEHLKELITTNQNFAEYNKQLRGIATNINQMAHHANAQGALPVKEYLATILELVMDMRKEGNQLWQLIRQSISRQNRMEP